MSKILDSFDPVIINHKLMCQESFRKTIKKYDLDLCLRAGISQFWHQHVADSNLSATLLLSQLFGDCEVNKTNTVLVSHPGEVATEHTFTLQWGTAASPATPSQQNQEMQCVTHSYKHTHTNCTACVCSCVKNPTT